MASARLTLAVCVLLLATFTLSHGLRLLASKRCCSTFNHRVVPKHMVVSYRRTSQQCPQPAVLFTTVAGKRLCGKPAASWVKELIRHLDEKMLPGQASPV